MKHAYSISDASKLLQVESHVLRYWEEELDLSIPRNEHGHRYYRETDINTFLYIKELKDNGLSLQEIRQKLSDRGYNTPEPSSGKSSKSYSGNKKELAKSAISFSRIEQAGREDKLDRFREIMNSIINSAISANNEQLVQSISDTTSERLMKEMNYLIRTLDEDEETRFKQIEAAITAALGAKNEIASSKNKKPGKKKLFSHKK
ncbi:MAG: MerR family transcriptional regulator [Lachnospiraceae bacterium]|nr:MerR family transcriptional regulator [Lachnospiraceae bacterium]